MTFDLMTGNVGNVTVSTTDGRGHNPEEIADRALEKLLYVGRDTDPVIQAQALAYKDRIRKVLVFYLQEAVNSHNVTIANRLRNAGHPELIPLLNKD